MSYVLPIDELEIIQNKLKYVYSVFVFKNHLGCMCFFNHPMLEKEQLRMYQ